MRKSLSQGLKDELGRFVTDLGACKMHVADAGRGFGEAIDGCRPRDVMPTCNSVIVFGIYIGSDYYHSIRIAGETAKDYRIMHLFRARLEYRLVEHLQEKRCDARTPRGYFDREKLIAGLSYKLAAHESGLGVFGRCGIIITPEYGPRVNFGVVLTDAVLEPDPRLMGFNPCNGCRLCADLCPPKAIRDDLNAPKGYDRDKCVNFVLRLREKTQNKNFLCGYCYDNCPFGKPTKRGFTLSGQRTLTGLEPSQRKFLVGEIIGSP